MNAIQTIQDARNRGVMIYTAPNLETPKAYKVEVTEIAAKESEFHNMKGKFMPNKSVTDRIGEASGVNFIAENCTVQSESRDDDFGKRTVFVGRAQGKVRISDGSWRESTVEEYEFDPKLRAMEDSGGSDKVEGFARKHLEYAKVGRARASTGARLRVIRQLVGLPVSFEKADISKPLLFSRIIMNTDEIMSTPEGRQAAVLVALGAADALYGQRRVTAPGVGDPTQEAHMAPAQDAHHDFDPGTSDAPTEPDVNPFRSNMAELVAKYGNDLGETAVVFYKDMLGKADTTDEQFASQLTKVTAWLKSQKGIDVKLSGVVQ